jgi:hypothetical protein
VFKIRNIFKNIFKSKQDNVLQVSLTGKTLLYQDSTGNIKGTVHHRTSAVFVWTVEQERNPYYILKMLRGHFDDYLTKEVKERLIEKVKRLVDTHEHYSIYPLLNNGGTIKQPWSSREIEIIKNLLGGFNEEI